MSSEPLPENVNAASAPRPPADLVIFDGHVYTVDPKHPKAEAVAVVADRIVAVGSDEEIHQWIGPGTRTIDAHGHTVMPGFIDSHVHFVDGGASLSSVQLKDASTPGEFTARIGAYARTLSPGEWVLEGEWDNDRWGGQLPTREWIDRVTPKNPVFIERYDGHMALANSLALKLAGVTRETKAPEGGEIVHDAAGEPTGVLKDAAMDLVDRAIPPSTERLRRSVLAALDEARKDGVTSVDDISLAPHVRMYQRLLAEGKLTARIYCITPMPDWQSLAKEGIQANFGSDWIRMGAVKGFADGSIGSRTALMFDPYTDQPGNRGLMNQMMYPEGNMLRMALGADKAGLQIAVHAIGDRANRIMLDVYTEVEKEDGPRDRRLRIEHAQHLRPQDLDAFAGLHVIASVQPYHAIDDGRWVEARIGHERARTSYAYGMLLEHGARLALGTDWPVAPLNPLLTVYAAVTRATPDGKHPGGWFPENKLTLEQTIYGYTMGSAYAQFNENEKGSLTTGKLADIIVLDRDLFAIPATDIKNVHVTETIVGGKVVYSAAAR
ncbi:MAG: amidohydrolase [Acidobacteriota bacterium]|nr:amidohydrolase [Acidobacteriota bacterium]